MLMPKRTKHRKMFRGRMKGNAQRGTTVAFGEYGLQALEPSWITNRQIESCRVGINRTFKREGKTFIRIFPDKPITARPAGVRMGKGKGNVEGWVCVVKPGRILFEVSGVTEEKAKAALRKAAMKLPIKCKIVKRDENGGEN
ncbi:50S ribosomal protein L16 [Fusobacterium necrophorum subsp. funduliforme]|mgnify:CR=1 FL=1|uniref:Large ribosomal subunit protein uL16 n=6 Tax=Fusobacterium necrophorum TaxID=859 RepID=A0A4Q2KZS9_9FUSO|nr:50S ribosomal protein L16 [Fusobacterium necrophorum]EHO16379.1 50S ribosomal protein L16 [Fusobacterium necrophorum subsp. funduliforme 1_1_36S]AVQ20360.1 50S ribosomal protein L16 [Fusobacterium necrophorum subsp. funduliforme]AYV93958.1 50S ribosomal protein L16 [Fusobacterium necrophorum subsp. funduliforme]AYV96124.1 50S ribosomal protein L16 [Fusobacterium necrophorum subsp. funduliforme]AYZ73597.1 50S ribosomal protein L16 [Fusobacterium necrophorum]